MFSKYYKITHKTQIFLLEYTYSSKILYDVSTTYINTSKISINPKTISDQNQITITIALTI